MDKTIKPARDQQDNSHLNRMKIMHVLRRSWQEKFGEMNKQQFDYLSDVSYMLAEQVHAHVLLNDADILAPEDILATDIVGKARLTKKYKPKIKPRVLDDLQKKGNRDSNIGAFLGLVGLIIIVAAALLI